MSRLQPYRAKRRLAETPEPDGVDHASSDAPIFVVQKHRARRLHYDLRLQVGDTLRSWAVPEGPCLDPKVRRFAKQVEDHPLAYARFEGSIPSGQYGAGEVIVWDAGDFVAIDDPATALERGELKFRLVGRKLRGGWMLKRLPDDPTHWLLIKERDDAARAISAYDVLIEEPASVVSKRHVEALVVAVKPQGLPAPQAKLLPGVKKTPMPASLRPQLATPASQPPSGPEWVHEIKFDGYRTLAFIDEGKVRLATRNGLDWTHRYRPLAAALATIRCHDAILDGEVAVQDARGVTTLNELEQALTAGQAHRLTYFAFDLVRLDGFDLSATPLGERKRALEALLDPLRSEQSPIHYSEHTDGDGAAFFEHACELGLEGIVSKRLDGPYRPGRSAAWVKVKRVDVADLVVIGYTLNAPKSVAALVLAEASPTGELLYSGKVGSGLSDDKARELFKRLSPSRVERSSVKGARIKGAVWIEPLWTARIGYRGRSESGAPRAPVFLALNQRQPPTATRSLKPRLIGDRDLAAVRLTHANREILEGSGVTKLDVALHYARVGDWMLPEVLRRPVTLVRCPTGRAEDCFYQRHAFSGLPEGVERVELVDHEGKAAFIAVTKPQGYLALAQFGAVEFHLWGCTIDNPEQPDRLVLDLDPDPEVSWTRLASAAERLRDRLAALGAEAFVRTTGGKGVHLVAALAPGWDWGSLRSFAEAFARLAAHEAPDVFTASPSKARRKGRIFIDYLRNARGATAVASYSLRARQGFPVATPIAWSELRRLSGAEAFTIKDIAQRLDSIRDDPWENLGSSPTKITPALRRTIGIGP